MLQVKAAGDSPTPQLHKPHSTIAAILTFQSAILTYFSSHVLRCDGAAFFLLIVAGALFY